MAAKRTKRWSPEDREWLAKLPDSERDHVLLAVAHLNAVPVDDVDDSGAYDISDPKHPSHHDVYTDLTDL